MRGQDTTVSFYQSRPQKSKFTFCLFTSLFLVFRHKSTQNKPEFDLLNVFSNTELRKTEQSTVQGGTPVFPASVKPRIDVHNCSAGGRARKLLLGLRYEVEALGLPQGNLFLPLQQALDCVRQLSHCHQGPREEDSAHLKIEFYL